jgi:ANTAR domain
VGDELDRAPTRRAPELGRAVLGAAARALHRTPRAVPGHLEPAELDRALRSEHDVAATLRRVVELAPSAVPGCEHVSVTLPDRGTGAATGWLPRSLDGIQYAAGSGPALDALAGPALTVSADLAAEDRWPEFAAGAIRSGMRSVLSCRLALGPTALGSLNFYAAAPGAFGPEFVAVAGAYAGRVTAALTRAAEDEQGAQLRQAVFSDRIVGTAVGLLMGTRRLSEAEAYDLLRAAGQESNRGLREVAADVLAGRRID